jgi:sigma-B regulation protein RsbU (phosphoserine phosphatase)
VPEEVFEAGIPKVISDLDIEKYEKCHSSTKRLGLKSIFCVPLKCMTHRDHEISGIGCIETIGVLYVDSQKVGPELSGIQLTALETLASEAAMAIYNARLYKKAHDKRKLDDEIEIARGIQQSLLPPPDKTAPLVNASSLNIPCRQVGGDYFDYFDLEDGRVGFAVGDVAGKGIPAALMTSKIQGILAALTYLDMPLHTLISNVNNILVERRIENRFITLFFGVIDREGNCTYTNAGHNPPILLGKDGSMQELTVGGIPLMIFADAEYRSDTVKLHQGDHLVLFTDGALEALNAKGEEFGEVRLHKLLKKKSQSPAKRILKSVQKAIADFSADAPQHDDITLMVLGFREG